MLLKCCTQYVSKFGKLSSGHRTGKRSVFILSPRRTMAKNFQTTAQLHSSHANKVMLKNPSNKASRYMNRELSDVQAGFRKGRGTRDQIANMCWIIEKARDFQKNIYFCFIDYTKAFDCVDHSKLWKILKETGTPYHLTCLCETCMQVKKQQLDLDVEQQTNSKLGEDVKAVYCHRTKCWAGWSTSWNQDCWEKYQQPQICRWLMGETEEKLKSLLVMVKEESVKAGLKLNIQNTKILEFSPIGS